MPSILNLPLSLNPSIVWPYLGLNESASTPEVERLIDQYIYETMRLSVPRGVWQTVNIALKENDLITLENSPLEIKGTTATAHFITSSKVTLLAATLGERLGSYLEELSFNKPAHALILDAVASAAVEHITEELDQLISRDIRRQGYYPTARFSPGYGSWPLSSQKEFLDSLQAKSIGLSVNAYFLLQPVKSVTAAIGWSQVPVPRDYELPLGAKPCQGTLTCSNCPLYQSCKSKT